MAIGLTPYVDIYDDTYDSTYVGTYINVKKICKMMCKKCVKISAKIFAKKSAKIFANESANIFAKLGAKKFTQNLHLFYTCKFCTLVCTSDHVKRPLDSKIQCQNIFYYSLAGMNFIFFWECLGSDF